MPHNPNDLLEKPFRFYFKRHWRTVALGLSCLLVTNFFESLIPWLVGQAIDRLTANSGEGVLRIVALLLAVTVVISIFRYSWRVFWGTFHHTAAEDLRNRMFAKYTELGASFFRSHKVGQMVSLIAH